MLLLRGEFSKLSNYPFKEPYLSDQVCLVLLEAGCTCRCFNIVSEIKVQDLSQFLQAHVKLPEAFRAILPRDLSVWETQPAHTGSVTMFYCFITEAISFTLLQRYKV